MMEKLYKNRIQSKQAIKSLQTNTGREFTEVPNKHSNFTLIIKNKILYLKWKN